MATRSKSKSKKKVWSTAKKGAKSAGFGKKSLKGELQRAVGFLRRGKFDKAYDALVGLDKTYPDTPAVLVELANYYANVNDIGQYQSTCERLIELDPNQSLFTIGLAQSYLATGSVMLALKMFRLVAEKWPDHAEIDEVKTFIQSLEEGVEDCLADLGVPNNAEGLAIAQSHEQVQCHLNRAEYDQAVEVGNALLIKAPDLPSVHNNVSLGLYFRGDTEGAIAQAQQVLDHDETNIHALGNLVRYYYVDGQVEKAKAIADRLLDNDSKAFDPWTKKLEAFSYLGDYETVLDLYNQGLESDDVEDSAAYDFFDHLGAVAMARLGNLSKARKVWQAIEKRSQFQIATQNLDDSNQSVSERHGAWSFELSQWLSPVVLKDFQETMDAIVALTPSGDESGEPEDDTRARELLNEFLDRHSGLDHVLSILLERGSPYARSLAFMMTKTVRRPEHLEALKTFALGHHGPDGLRYKAAVEVVSDKLINKRVSLWMHGKQQEIILMAYEFHEDVDEIHTEEVDELLVKSIDLLNEARDADDKGDQESAERLYHEVEDVLGQALAMEPDAPDLRNNLAACYHSQGKLDEAIALLDQVIEDSPDYVHARTSRAKLYISAEEIEAARELLLPMLEWDRFHFDDFSEFSDTYMAFLMAQDQEEGAQQWLNMWQQVDPESDKLFRWMLRLTDKEELMKMLQQQNR